ncbi:hypothetical protein GYMLUDRAFT_158512 [Collybiopsis luxurians FD-317 M1]|nr:hypothetical protein GYMLUDRAFT_158512 [Collybiopsis luxurians FD-317 M1]
MDLLAAAQPFGLPFDSNEGDTAMSHWTLFTAGTVNNTSTRDSLVSIVHAAASNQQTFVVFPTAYSPSNGDLRGGAARHIVIFFCSKRIIGLTIPLICHSPAQGAMYSLLTLQYV